MSNLEPRPETVSGGAVDVVDQPVWELMAGREVVLGGTRAMGTDAMTVTRTLPNRERRMVGPWCFVDHFGEADVEGDGGKPSGVGDGGGMRIPPHPHTGLQTVTWLLDGEILHRDSLGSAQLIAPGQLNLMTAGRAIAHSEVSTAAGVRHGVQLWVALPDQHRAVEPHFEHHPRLPTFFEGAASVTVLMGALAGVASSARTYSPLVGAQISLTAGTATLPLDPDFEYAVLGLAGEPTVAGAPLPPGPLLYLGRDRRDLTLAGAGQLLLLGGVPFDEKIIMWWNFIGRSHDEIVADREDWMTGRRFGPVVGFDGPPLPAPELPGTPLRPRGRLR